MTPVLFRLFRYSIATIFLLLISAVEIFSQSSENANVVSGISENYVMEIWDNSNGLPQNAVFAMEKDNHGYLWVSTEEGLVRFDGNSPKIFDQDNYPEMLEQTYYIFFKTKGGIWATGDRSIVLLDKNVKTVIDCSKIAANTWIRAIAESTNGGLLIGNQKGEIFTWEEGQFNLLSYWKPKEPLEIMGFYPLDNNKILVGTTKGLYELDQHAGKAKLVSREDISALKIFGNKESLYLFSADKGIYEISDDYSLVPILRFEEAKVIAPTSLIVDSENTIWAGSVEKGLIKLSKGQISTVIFPELQTYSVRKIIKEDNNIYLGTLGKGLAVVRPAEINQPNIAELAHKNIKPIYQAPDSSIWIGTKSDGLFRVKNGKSTNWNTENGLAQNRVNSIGSVSGKVYVGSIAGITLIDQKSGKISGYLNQENGLHSNYVNAIFRDSKNWLWILTRYGGIHYLDEKGNLHQVELDEMYSNTNFISILELKNKQILIGSISQGLFRLENGKLIENQSLPLTPSENLIYSIYQDNDGDLWYATHGGIVLQKQGEFKMLRKSQGLKSRSVFTIIHDGHSGIWTTNNFGVQYFADSELAKFKNSSEKDFHIANTFYNESHGMPNSEGNGLIFPSALKDYAGQIWIPTVEGVGIIQTSAFSEKASQAFNFLWDELNVAGEKYDIQKEIIIPKGERTFQVSFSLIDFANPDQYSLYYRINQNSEQWLPIKDQRQLNFTGLKSGKYKLEVKILRHGKDEKIFSLPILVSPSLVETLAFKLVALFVFGLLLYFIVKYYLNIKIKKKLEGMVDQRTFELSKTNDQLKEALKEIESRNRVLMDITWSQSHLVRAPLTKAMGIAQLISQYSNFDDIGLSKEELEKELLDALEQLDQMVRETHAKSENIKNNDG